MALASGTQPNRSGFANQAHRIFIVEDHPRMRRLITSYVNRMDDLTVTGQAATAEAALEDPELHIANLVVTDLSLSGMSGVELTRRLCAEDPERPIIVLSAMLERFYMDAALAAGACAFVAKDCFNKLEDVILRVLAGERDISMVPAEVSSRA